MQQQQQQQRQPAPRCLATRRSEQGTGAAPRYRQASARGLICPLGLVTRARCAAPSPRAGGQGTSPVAALARHHHGSSAAPSASCMPKLRHRRGGASRLSRCMRMLLSGRGCPLPLLPLALRKGCIVWLRARRQACERAQRGHGRGQRCCVLPPLRLLVACPLVLAGILLSDPPRCAGARAQHRPVPSPAACGAPAQAQGARQIGEL